MQGAEYPPHTVTQKNKIQELNGVKQKRAPLEVQNKELATLAEQQKEKDRILSELKSRKNNSITRYLPSASKCRRWTMQ